MPLRLAGERTNTRRVQASRYEPIARPTGCIPPSSGYNMARPFGLDGVTKLDR